MARFDKAKLATYPTSCGVYLMKNAQKKILYVGKAKNLRSRIKQYFSKTLDGRETVPYLIEKVESIEFILTADEKDALFLENTLIKKHQPQYNLLLKDDKTYISLFINTKHKWPMIRLVRYKGAPKKDGLYFGPYTSAFSARSTLKVLQKVFPLRQCSDKELSARKRPCLLFDIKRCLAPCVNHCLKSDYDDYVKKAEQFLKGKDKEVIDQLTQKMHQASEELEFEKAQEILQTLKQLNQIQSQSSNLIHSKAKNLDSLYLYTRADFAFIMQLQFRSSHLIGSDYFTFKNVLQSPEELLESFILQHYQNKAIKPQTILVPKDLFSSKLLEEILSETSHQKVSIEKPKKGEKKKILDLTKKNALAILNQEEKHFFAQEELLLQLQETLKLTACPLTIECFDTSSSGGKDFVAVMVRYFEGRADKSMYRKYIIKSENKDDYSALEEAIYRRYLKLSQDLKPDLVIVDGGKGQLGIVHKVFKKLQIANIDFISLAKEQSLHTKSLTQEKIYTPSQKEPIELHKHSPLLFFLQSIRDEAHRFAISFYRKKEKKKITLSELDQIDGIGAVKKKRLLQHFKSVSAIKNSSKKDLDNVKGLTSKDKEILAKKLGMKS